MFNCTWLPLLLFTGFQDAPQELLPLKSDLAEIVIEGPLENLQLSVDGVAVFDPPPLTEGISETEIARRLFHFASAQFTAWDAQPRTGMSALFYGYGFGACGEQARFLGNLWFRSGIKSRIVSLPNHVMIEANLEGQWCLFDPQHHTDFSALLAAPTSFEKVATGKVPLPTHTDAIGYTWSHMAGVYQGGKPVYSPLTSYHQPPRLNLGSGQTMTIRPRDTGEYFFLPIVYTKRPDYQTNLLPFYLLEVEYDFDKNRTETGFDCELPILQIHWEGRAVKVLAVDREHQINVAKENRSLLAKRLEGKPHQIKVGMLPGGRFRVTYALAGWAGDRLFKAKGGAQLRVSAKQGLAEARTIYRTPPNLSIGPIQIFKSSKKQGSYDVSVDLCWQNLAYANATDLHMVLDEQETGLLMEYLTHVGRARFRWDPDLHPKTGRKTFSFSWVPAKTKSKRVPYDNRLLLAQIIGPKLRAGNHFRLTAFSPLP